MVQFRQPGGTGQEEGRAPGHQDRPRGQDTRTCSLPPPLPSPPSSFFFRGPLGRELISDLLFAHSTEKLHKGEPRAKEGAQTNGGVPDAEDQRRQEEPAAAAGTPCATRRTSPASPSTTSPRRGISFSPGVKYSTTHCSGNISAQLTSSLPVQPLLLLLLLCWSCCVVCRS